LVVKEHFVENVGGKRHLPLAGPLIDSRESFLYEGLEKLEQQGSLLHTVKLSVKLVTSIVTLRVSISASQELAFSHNRGLRKRT
jgi:hypothetical protein